MTLGHLLSLDLHGIADYGDFASDNAFSVACETSSVLCHSSLQI